MKDFLKTNKEFQKLLEDNVKNIQEIEQTITSHFKTHCKRLYNYIRIPDNNPKFEAIIKGGINFNHQCNESTYSISISTIPDIDELSFIENEFFIWDKSFLQYIEDTFKDNDKIKPSIQKIETMFGDCVHEFKTQDNINTYYWFNKNDRFYISPILKILINLIWENQILDKINWGKKNPAALTTNVKNDLKTIFLGPITTIEINNELQVFSNGKLIGMAPNTVKIKESLHLLASKTSARLILHLAIKTYEQYIKLISEHKTLEYPGGGTQLAIEMGLKKGRDVGIIKDLIHLLDHLKIHGNGIKTRLISLAECEKKSKYSSRGGWKINVQDPLAPFYFFEQKSILIPILNSMSFIGDNRTHSKQILMAVDVIELITRRADQIYKHGSVEITKKDIKNLAYEFQIPEELVFRVIENWCKPNGFLEKVKDNYYTINKKGYSKELKFIENRGKDMVIGSIKGIASKEKKQKQKTFSNKVVDKLK